jgi:CxxC motif-containing protein
MTELICTVCPRGCHLKVYPEENYRVVGHQCARGVKYGQEEVKNPCRIITSTVCIEGAEHPRCPVKTNAPVPRQMIFNVVKTLNNVCLRSPVKAGDIVVENACGTGVDFITTRSM